MKNPSEYSLAEISELCTVMRSMGQNTSCDIAHCDIFSLMCFIEKANKLLAEYKVPLPTKQEPVKKEKEPPVVFTL
jgi:hypothetical protein